MRSARPRASGSTTSSSTSSRAAPPSRSKPTGATRLGREEQLDLYAFSGSLNVREVIGAVKAQTFSGDIDLDVSRASDTPRIEAETFSGNITTRVPPGGSGRLRFETFSGDLDSELPLTLRSASSRRRVTAALGSGAGEALEFTTFSGDLRLLK